MRPLSAAYAITNFTIEGVFVPALSRNCFNIENYGVNRYNLSIAIDLTTQKGEQFDIYLTDKSHWIMTSPYLPSHWGPTISFNNEFFIEIEKVSNFDPKNPESCKDYDDNDYQNCINNRLPFLDCNPPWYSTQNPCTSVYDQNISWSMIDVVDSIIFGKIFGINVPNHALLYIQKLQLNI